MATAAPPATVRIDWVMETRVRLDRAGIRRVVASALTEAGVARAALTVLVIDAQRSRALHAEHFADDTPTDVMTFPDGAELPDGRIHVGDLAVCADVAAAEARARGRRVADELALYVLHGVLHLTGYDDRTPRERARMWQAQRRLLATVGIAIEARPG